MLLGLLRRLLAPKLFGPRMLANPYPYYARLRSRDPVHWAEAIGGWVLTRYADVMTVFRSPDASAERTALARKRIPAEFLTVPPRNVRRGCRAVLRGNFGNGNAIPILPPQQSKEGRNSGSGAKFVGLDQLVTGRESLQDQAPGRRGAVAFRWG